MAVQVNGNQWLRLNPSLLDEADIFMYSSQLVRSVHLQMQTLIPPRLCSMLILLEYFILRAHSLSLSLSYEVIPRSIPFQTSLLTPSIILLPCLEVACLCEGAAGSLRSSHFC